MTKQHKQEQLYAVTSLCTSIQLTSGSLIEFIPYIAMIRGISGENNFSSLDELKCSEPKKLYRFMDTFADMIA